MQEIIYLWFGTVYETNKTRLKNNSCTKVKKKGYVSCFIASHYCYLIKSEIDLLKFMNPYT